MKIFHVWDQAAVACTLAKYQEKLGNESLVVKRNGFDKFKILDFYKQQTMNVTFNKIFSFLVIKKAKEYDVIHVHDQYHLLADLRKKYPDKILILHYHGSILRLTPREKLESFEKFADKILISTPDLLDFVDAEYLPNPIDVEHFRKREIKKNGKALSVMSKWESQNELKKLLKQNQILLDVEFLDREKEPVLYAKIPDFLSNYEYLVDLKLVYNGNPIPAFGCLGLQALNLGLKVINHSFNVNSEFPQQHDPETVTKKLMTIYEESMRK